MVGVTGSSPVAPTTYLNSYGIASYKSPFRRISSPIRWSGGSSGGSFCGCRGDAEGWSRRVSEPGQDHAGACPSLGLCTARLPQQNGVGGFAARILLPMLDGQARPQTTGRDSGSLVRIASPLLHTPWSLAKMHRMSGGTSMNEEAEAVFKDLLEQLSRSSVRPSSRAGCLSSYPRNFRLSPDAPSLRARCREGSPGQLLPPVGRASRRATGH